MEAIEFNYESRGGVIKIPECYKDWFKRSFKVILLTQELPHNFKPTQRRLPKGAGCYRSGRSDISRRAEELLFQKREEEK